MIKSQHFQNFILYGGCASYQICDRRRKNDQKNSHKMVTLLIFSTL